MSGTSSLHRTDKASKSRSQVRGRPAILLEAAPVSDMDGSEPYSPALFGTRDVNAMPAAGGKSLSSSKPTSVHRTVPMTTTRSRADSGFSSTSMGRRAPVPEAAHGVSGVRSLPAFASSLSGSAMQSSHRFHRDDDESSQLFLMKENTNLEMPSTPAHTGADGKTDSKAVHEDDLDSPTVDLGRAASSWSRSAPASRNISPPPRPAELATDFPSYEDSLSSVASRCAGPVSAHRASIEMSDEAAAAAAGTTAPTTTTTTLTSESASHPATRTHVQPTNATAVGAEEEDTTSQYASPTPPPRHAVVLPARSADANVASALSSAASSFVVPAELPTTTTTTAAAVAAAAARGSTMLISSAQSDALTSLFRLNRRAVEAREGGETAAVADESFVLAADEQQAEVEGPLPVAIAMTEAMDSASFSAAQAAMHVTDASLETRLYPLHTDVHEDGRYAGFTLADESMSPLPRPLRPSQRALAAPEDPPLSAATAEVVRAAREKRAAAPSADRHRSPDAYPDEANVVATAAPPSDLADDLRASATIVSDDARHSSAVAQKDSVQLVTAASSAVWLTDGHPPLYNTGRRLAESEAEDEARPLRTTTTTTTTTSVKLSESMAEGIDSRDFRTSEPRPARSAEAASISPVPQPPIEAEAIDEQESLTPPARLCEHAKSLNEDRENELDEIRSPMPRPTMELEGRSLSALDTPSRRVSDEVRQLMEKAQEEVRRTRESLLSTIEKSKQSLQRASGVPLAVNEEEVDGRASDQQVIGEVSATTTTTITGGDVTDHTTTATTISLSPMTPDVRGGQHRTQEDDALEPSRALQFAIASPAQAVRGDDGTPVCQRVAASGRLSAAHRTFAWSVRELRTELATVADAILRRLKGYDWQNHGVLPMEVVLRVTYFVMQQRHPERLLSLAETPARGGALLAASASAAATTPRDCLRRPSAHAVHTPLETRMSGHTAARRYQPTLAGRKRLDRPLDTATEKAQEDASKENLDSSASMDVWWPSPAVKRSRVDLCLRETGSPEPGQAVPYPRDTKDSDEGEDVELGRPATRISPSRTLELLAASQARRAEEDVCMDLYTTLLSAFREVFGERYAWRHLGATNATRHDAYFPLRKQAQKDEETEALSGSAAKEGRRASSTTTPRSSSSSKKCVLKDLNDVPPPLETAFPRLRQQYAIRTRSADGSGRHICDPLHPPPLDILVYYGTFVESLRELAE